MNKSKLLSILNSKKDGQSWNFFIECENIQTELTKSALYVGESPQETKYRLTHDIKTRPVCKCGNFLEFKSKYKQFCSKKCSSKYAVRGTSQAFKKRVLEEICYKKLTVKELISLKLDKFKLSKWSAFIESCGLETVFETNSIYEDDTLIEIAFRLLNDLKFRPTCKNANCDKFVTFLGTVAKGYTEKCSDVCSKNKTNLLKSARAERWNRGTTDPVEVLKLRPTGVKYNMYLEFHGVTEFVNSAKIRPEETHKETIYRLVNGMCKIPKCKCGNILSFNQFTNEYYKTCSYECNGKNSIESNKVKNLEKYGVEYTVQRTDVKDKSTSTMIEKYGVRNFSQAGLSSNGYKWKDYEMPSGEVRRVQGYENFLLDCLLESHSEVDVKTSRVDMPEFWYSTEDGKSHRYFPDAFVVSTGTVYEVKSTYTVKLNETVNVLKFKSVEDAGFDFVLKVYDSKGNEV